MKHGIPVLGTHAKTVALAACMTLLPTLQATAQDTRLIDASNPQRILEIAKGFGLAELDRTSSGAPRISGRIEGKRYTLNFYGCKDGEKCKSLQFWTLWPASQSPGLEAINTWNATKRFSTAYLDKDGYLILQMDVNPEFGVSAKNMEDNFSWWLTVVSRFKADVIKD